MTFFKKTSQRRKTKVQRRDYTITEGNEEQAGRAQKKKNEEKNNTIEIKPHEEVTRNRM